VYNSGIRKIIQLFAAAFLVTPVYAQSTATAPAETPFGIVDNSFLIEEAFNQDAGIFQNIATFKWRRGEWLGSFTQEWPAPTRTHQLSYTIPFGRLDDGASFGDVQINYRFQMAAESRRTPAFSPRVSVILPSGSTRDGLGNGAVGWQVGLPLSKQFDDVYVHVNAGLTYVPGAHSYAAPDKEVSLVSPTLGGSAVWQASQTLNLLLEVLYESNESVTAVGSASREKQMTLSPGFRQAVNGLDKQLVFGLALPVTLASPRNEVSVLGYLSYELRFRR
jgi:hypothetical protein